MSRADHNLHIRRGFTLLELLVVIAIIGVLSALIVPVVGKSLAAGKSAACQSNLHQLFSAYTMYLDDHDGRFFRLSESTARGTLWYWGLESGGSGEGNRQLDKSKARLAPYFDHVGGIEICPAFPYGSSGFKQKFDVASYGYGINLGMLAGSPAAKKTGIQRFDQIRKPSETIAWADACQVNTWQAPASAKNPMLEEFYFLDASAPPKFHFRHGGHCNAIMADGSVRAFEPAQLDPRCDGLTGYIEKPGQDYYLRLVK